MKFLDQLKQSRLGIWLLGLFGIGVVGTIDYLSGTELAFSVFYLFPVALIAWFLGRGSAIAGGALAALAWLVAELLWMVEYSHPLVPFWNASVRGALFMVSGALISEIAQRKRVEAALRSQTGILESILNSMGDGVIVADTQARILLYNPAAERLLRSSLSNVTFQDWLLQQQIFLPDRLTPYPVQEHPLMKAIRGESTDSAEMFLRDPRTKEEIWLSATGRPLMQNKREKGGVLVFSDVSSSKLLEKQIAEVSDRERLRMGQDLHDGVCQQLVSTAFAASVLRQKLEEKGIQEAKSAEQIVDLLNDAITDARRLARGLYPVKLEVDGLTIALEELAENVEHMSEINCRFECDQPVSISDPVVATNLFRIAQEAVNNAIKHSQAKNIIIELEAVEEEVTLSVRDDGVGFSGKKAENGSGMGLHIMNYRARLIGASLDVRPSATGGTTVICSFLNLNQVKDTHEHTRAA